MRRRPCCRHRSRTTELAAHFRANAGATQSDASLHCVKEYPVNLPKQPGQAYRVVGL